MKHQSKFKSAEQEQPAAGQQQAQQPAAREFATAEELLRFDATQTAVPGGIERRLKQSSVDCPKPPRSWWRRLLGGPQP